MNDQVLQSCIDYINPLITTDYTIIKYEDRFFDFVYNLSNYEEGCIYSPGVYTEPGLLMVNNKTGDIVAYLFFSFKTTSIDFQPFIAIDLLCTSTKHRRKGLSTYLILVCFIYAMQTDQVYIAADVNPDSIKILKKFGFEGYVDGFIENFGWLYSVFVETQSPVFQSKVDFFIKDRV